MSAIHDLTSYFHQLQARSHRHEQIQCHGRNQGLRALEPQLLEALKMVMLAALAKILEGKHASSQGHPPSGQDRQRDAGVAPPSSTAHPAWHAPSPSPAPSPAPSTATSPAPSPTPSPAPRAEQPPAPAPSTPSPSAAQHKPPTEAAPGTTATGRVRPPSTEGLEVVVVNKPIVVKPGEDFDGKGKLFVAGPGLKGGGTAETADPVFIVGPGAKMSNVAYQGGDGIHLLHDAKLDQVHAIHGGPDDMITIDGPGNQARDAQLAGISLSSIPKRPAEVSITNSSFQHSHDKAIQINGDANLKLDNIYAKDVGQLAVTLGGAPIEAHVSLNNAQLEDVRSHTFRFDSVRSSLTLGDHIDMGGAQMSVMMGDTGKVHGGQATVRPTTDRAA